MVADMVREVLQGGGTQPEEDLADRVGERLEACGRSRDGVLPLVMRALREGSFNCSPSGWSVSEHTVLAEQAPAQPTMQLPT